MGITTSKSDTRTTHKSPSPRRTSSNRKTVTNRNQQSSRLYFDPSLPVWSKTIQPALAGREREIFLFAESHEDRYTKSTIVSRPVLRWIDSHWSELAGFCDGALDTDNARMRFRGVEYANLNVYNVRPTTNSPRFSPHVDYARNAVLCIRSDGLIEGFALLDMSDDEEVELDVLCVGPKKTGVGRLLINAIKRLTVAAGREGIKLTAVSTSVGFYKKLGFRIEEEDEDEEEEDKDMVWTITETD